jgi:hypothetical protein
MTKQRVLARKNSIAGSYGQLSSRANQNFCARQGLVRIFPDYDGWSSKQR